MQNVLLLLSYQPIDDRIFLFQLLLQEPILLFQLSDGPITLLKQLPNPFYSPLSGSFFGECAIASHLNCYQIAESDSNNKEQQSYAGEDQYHQSHHNTEVLLLCFLLLDYRAVEFLIGLDCIVPCDCDVVVDLVDHFPLFSSHHFRHVVVQHIDDPILLLDLLQNSLTLSRDLLLQQQLIRDILLLLDLLLSYLFLDVAGIGVLAFVSAVGFLLAEVTPPHVGLIGRGSVHKLLHYPAVSFDLSACQLAEFLDLVLGSGVGEVLREFGQHALDLVYFLLSGSRVTYRNSRWLLMALRMSLSRSPSHCFCSSLFLFFRVLSLSSTSSMRRLYSFACFFPRPTRSPSSRSLIFIYNLGIYICSRWIVQAKNKRNHRESLLGYSCFFSDQGVKSRKNVLRGMLY